MLGVVGFALLDCDLAQVLVKGSEAEVDVRHTVVSKRKRCFLDLERFLNLDRKAYPELRENLVFPMAVIIGQAMSNRRVYASRKSGTIDRLKRG